MDWFRKEKSYLHMILRNLHRNNICGLPAILFGHSEMKLSNSEPSFDDVNYFYELLLFLRLLVLQ